MIHSNTNSMHASLLVALNAKNRAIANNVANADTPYYKAQSVVFEEELRRKLERDKNGELRMRRTDPRHMPTPVSSNEVAYQVVQSQNTAMNNNFNNVDVDKEMSELAENHLMYNYTIDRVNGYYSKMKNLLSQLK
ncbi:flagellar basal body rod protein FlgB [Paenibacillus massiliensis]|uniref:flagellar basal body rod protein FlgB n=1 Tax=Paenibacillus massiliensis TaxID=225917 RepID=UPI000406E2FF|nr:flagellar basal body rod protein FlgB [Paenibacillus massiliensis]